MGVFFVVVLTLNGVCAAGNTERLICLMWADGQNEIRTPKVVCFGLLPSPTVLFSSGLGRLSSSTPQGVSSHSQRCQSISSLVALVAL